MPMFLCSPTEQGMHPLLSRLGEWCGGQSRHSPPPPPLNCTPPQGSQASMSTWRYLPTGHGTQADFSSVDTSLAPQASQRLFPPMLTSFALHLMQAVSAFDEQLGQKEGLGDRYSVSLKSLWFHNILKYIPSSHLLAHAKFNYSLSIATSMALQWRRVREEKAERNNRAYWRWNLAFCPHPTGQDLQGTQALFSSLAIEFSGQRMGDERLASLIANVISNINKPQRFKGDTRTSLLFWNIVTLEVSHAEISLLNAVAVENTVICRQNTHTQQQQI